MNQILYIIKKCIPAPLFKALQPAYHYVMGFLAALVYGFPSRKMIVIGVTGTTGKTTVVYMLAQMLQNAGIKVGYTSTAMFGDGEREWLNDKKMTMLGRGFTQKMLRTMIKNGCQVAIVETTSEGAVQFRHRFINYDVFLFTGLYPEHIDSHGSFENYKKAKLSLFTHMMRCKDKSLLSLNDAPQRLAKTVIVHGDDEHAQDFLDAAGDEIKKMSYNRQNVGLQPHGDIDQLLYAYKKTTLKGVLMELGVVDVELNLLGVFTATNAAAAAAVGRALGLKPTIIKKGLEKIMGVPGRLERIFAGQDFTVLVDYAFEPVAVTKLYDTVASLEPERIIHVLGSTGGGRDLARRGELGEIAGERADVVIVTNEDPYDDDPRAIMEDVSTGVTDRSKVQIIEDRGEAIGAAIAMAEKGDVILITGKGCEQAIAISGGRHLPWDDREIARSYLKA